MVNSNCQVKFDSCFFIRSKTCVRTETAIKDSPTGLKTRRNYDGRR